MTRSEKGDVKYLIANKQDMAWGMVITTAGHQTIEAGANYPSVNHPTNYLFSTGRGRVLNEYQLVYISHGKGWFQSRSVNKIEIQEGMFFILFPGEWHNYYPDPNTGWCESWIGFYGTNMDNRFKSGFFTPIRPIFNAGIQDEILALFKKAVRISQEQHAGYQQMLAGIVNFLLGIAYSENRRMTFEEMKISNTINKAKIFIQEHVSENISCEMIADAVGMGYSRFRRIFKDYTGFAPAQYVKEIRLNKARDLLVHTAFSCQEIAYSLGFESPAYFNTFFKKEQGMPPNEYRRIFGV